MNPVQFFEDEFKKYTESPHSVAVNSGTAALHCALTALGIGFGDIVVTTPFTFPATANAILMAGAKPLFVDIREDNHLIDMRRVEEAVTGEHGLFVKAVLPVHLFGRACEMETLMNLSETYGFKVIEDASQAVGARYLGKHLGTFGDAGTFSFYASKNLSAYQGGMVTTPHLEVDEYIRRFRRHGFENGEMVSFGMNYEMPWNCAFEGWQNLVLHKKGIEAELGKVNELDGYYGKLVYQHQWYSENPQMWIKNSCPVAEATARRVNEQ